MRTEINLSDIEIDLHTIRRGQGPLNGKAVGKAEHILGLPRYVYAGQHAPDLLAADLKTAIGRLTDDDDLSLVAEYLLRLKHPYEPVTARMDALASEIGKNSSRVFRGWMERYIISALAFDLYALGVQPAIALPGSRLVSGFGYSITSHESRLVLGRDYPDQQHQYDVFHLQAYRDDVQLFRFGIDPECSVVKTVWCESENLGHRYLSSVPVVAERPNGPQLSYFYLGRTLRTGDTATICTGQEWDNTGCPEVREHGSRALIKNMGPLHISLEAPRSLVPEYALASYLVEDPTMSGRETPLRQRTDDSAIIHMVEAPQFNYRYDIIYRVCH